MTGSTAGRVPVRWAVTACALLVGTAALGDSAAVPGLGPASPWPPWDLAAGPPSWLVSVVLLAGWGTGGLALLTGLRALARGARAPARLPALTAVAILAMVLVPPLGSADHLSYLAYGRIAEAGDDPYLVPPLDWRSGTDPVAGAVQPPWERTPSVYGPVATAVQVLAVRCGGGDLRASSWAWQILCALAFGAVVWMLLARAGDDGPARARIAVLVALNPLLLGQLVLGAHLDVVAAAAGLGALLAARRRPTLAGILLGAAVGMKAPYVLVGVAVCWGLRNLPLRTALSLGGRGVLGALAVLVPAYHWAGPHAFDQLGRASRYVSIATPWRGAANLVDLVLGPQGSRPAIVPLSGVLTALLAVVMIRKVGRLPVAPGTARPAPAGDPGPRKDLLGDGDGAGSGPSRVTADAIRAAAVLSFCWVLLAPYALPWYDALVWGPVALLGPSLIDTAIVARLTVLCLAYLPGRVVGMSRIVEEVTLAGRRFCAPVLVLAVQVLVVRWALSDPDRPRSAVTRTGGAAGGPGPPGPSGGVPQPP